MKKNKSVKAEKPKSPRKPRAKKANGKPAAQPIEREPEETSTEATVGSQPSRSEATAKSRDP